MKRILEYELFSYGENIEVTIMTLLIIILTILFTRIILWLLWKGFSRRSKQKNIDKGRQHSLFQIVKYILYFIALILILNSLNIGLSGILLGSGALLVGVGIALQQTFRDIFSGIIILFEGSIQANDKLIIDDTICRVNKIGVRATEVITIDGYHLIIPNAIFTTTKVQNWSHSKTPVRFHIDIRTSFKDDIATVEKLLLSSLEEQPEVFQNPKPTVQLMNYGEFAIEFRLYFYCIELFSIPRIQSDIRKRAFEILKKNNIEIPFPKQDISLSDNRQK